MNCFNVHLHYLFNNAHMRMHTNTYINTLYQAFHQYYCLDLIEDYAPMLAPPPIAWNLNLFQQRFEHVFVPKETIEYPRPHSYMVGHVCSFLHVL